MEDKQLDLNKLNKAMSSEFILPPMKVWNKTENISENSAVESISQIRQKHKDCLFMEIYESGRILHNVLANRIPVSVSGLNAVIKKMNESFIKCIQETKAGKYKFYTLTDEGEQYVETILHPLIMSNRRDEEEVHNLFYLLAMYKDQNQDSWCNNLKAFLDKGNINEDIIAEEINSTSEYELLQAFGQFYHREYNKACNLLELCVADKELRQSIISYFENKYGNKNCVWSVLNQWEQQDALEVYRMIDDLFQSIDAERKIVEKTKFCLKDIDMYYDVIQNKIQADVLQAIFRQWSKNKILDIWLEEDMDIHLALYLAEKYRILFEHLVQKLKN